MVRLRNRSRMRGKQRGPLRKLFRGVKRFARRRLGISFLQRGSRARKLRAGDDGNGNKRVSHRYGKRMPRLSRKLAVKIRKDLQPISTQVIRTMGSTIGSHNHTHYTLFEMCDPSAVATMIGNLNSQGDPIALDKTSRFMVYDAAMNVQITNNENMAANIRVYEYIARHNVPASQAKPSTLSILQSGWSENAHHEFLQDTLGSTVFMNPEFCAYYKVVAVKQLVVGSGKTLNLNLRTDKAYTINPAIANFDDVAAYGRWTRGYIVQASGKPAAIHDQPNQAAVSSTKLTFNQEMRYHFNLIAINQGYTFLSANEYEGNRQAMADDQGGAVLAEANA